MQIRKIKPNAFYLENNSPILRSADYEILLSTQQAVQQTKKEEAERQQQSRILFEKTRKAGYQQGEQQAQALLLQRHLDFVENTIDFIANLEKNICQLIQESMPKIVGSLDIDNVTKAIIHKAISSYGLLPKIKLRVATSQEAIAHEVIETIASQRGRNTLTYSIQVEASEHLQKGDCILESPIGSVDASLDTQLDALREAFNRIVHKHIQFNQQGENKHV